MDKCCPVAAFFKSRSVILVGILAVPFAALLASVAFQAPPAGEMGSDACCATGSPAGAASLTSCEEIHAGLRKKPTAEDPLPCGISPAGCPSKKLPAPPAVEPTNVE